MVADRGLRDTQSLSGLPETASFLNLQEDLKLADSEIEHRSRMSDKLEVVTP
ncbi:MAG: hypothetical protein K0R64_1434 [Novosphingobium lindaniclasticum]|nr:hypothetical protein [Novosphingobium lindaniclasticum]